MGPVCNPSQLQRRIRSSRNHPACSKGSNAPVVFRASTLARYAEDVPDPPRDESKQLPFLQNQSPVKERGCGGGGLAAPDDHGWQHQLHCESGPNHNPSAQDRENYVADYYHIVTRQRSLRVTYAGDQCAMAQIGAWLVAGSWRTSRDLP